MPEVLAGNREAPVAEPLRAPTGPAPAGPAPVVPTRITLDPSALPAGQLGYATTPPGREAILAGKATVPIRAIMPPVRIPAEAAQPSEPGSVETPPGPPRPLPSVVRDPLVRAAIRGISASTLGQLASRLATPEAREALAALHAEATQHPPRTFTEQAMEILGSVGPELPFFALGLGPAAAVSAATRRAGARALATLLDAYRQRMVAQWTARGLSEAAAERVALKALARQAGTIRAVAGPILSGAERAAGGAALFTPQAAIHEGVRQATEAALRDGLDPEAFLEAIGHSALTGAGMAVGAGLGAAVPGTTAIAQAGRLGATLAGETLGMAAGGAAAEGRLPTVEDVRQAGTAVAALQPLKAGQALAALQRWRATRDAARAATVPETPDAVRYQLQALVRGRKPAVEVPIELTPLDGPDLRARGGRIRSVVVSNGNRLYYRTDAMRTLMGDPRATGRELDAWVTEQYAQGRAGLLLGYGVPEKPPPTAPTAVVQVQDAQGREVQTVLARPEEVGRVVASVQPVTPPGGHVEVTPPPESAGAILDTLRTRLAETPSPSAPVPIQPPASQAFVTALADEVERRVVQALQEAGLGPARPAASDAAPARALPPPARPLELTERPAAPASVPPLPEPPAPPRAAIPLAPAVPPPQMLAPGEAMMTVRRPAPEGPGGASAPESGEATTPARPPAPPAAPGPSRVREVPLQELDLEPQRFQYKLGSDRRTGTTGAVTGVTRWDPHLAGAVAVWRDPADQRLKVVNGHHRVDLARRLAAAGDPSAPDRIAVLEIQAENAAQARAVGALINIAEGRGTPLDAGRFFRDTGMTAEDLRAHGVPMRESIVRDGLALARLHPSLFERVVDGRLPADRGIIIGQRLAGPDVQWQFFQLLQKAERRRALTSGQIDELATMAASAPTRQTTTLTLFGPERTTTSLAFDLARLAADIRQRLSQDRRLFGTVSRTGAATRLEAEGSRIDVERARAVSAEAGAILALFDRLKYVSGPIYDALRTGAEQLAEGRSADVVRIRTYQAIRQALPRLLGSGPGDRVAGGPDVRPVPPPDRGGAPGEAPPPAPPPGTHAGRRPARPRPAPTTTITPRAPAPQETPARAALVPAESPPMGPGEAAPAVQRPEAPPPAPEAPAAATRRKAPEPPPPTEAVDPALRALAEQPLWRLTADQYRQLQAAGLVRAPMPPIPSAAAPGSSWRPPRRPDASPETERLGRAAYRDLIELRRRLPDAERPIRGLIGGAGVRTLGAVLAQELPTRGRVDLRGQVVRTHGDLAQLAQIFRDPRLETLRVIYLRGRQILDHEGFSLRLPAVASMFLHGSMARDLAAMRVRMARLGADGYYLLHNHPSGVPRPSAEDRSLTRDVAARVPGLRGHVIIDHGTYALITARDHVRVYPLPGRPTKTPRIAPVLPHPWLARTAMDPGALARLARDVQTPEGWATIVYLNAQGQIAAIQEASERFFLERPRDFVSYLRGRRRVFGAPLVALAVDGRHPELLRLGEAMVRDGLAIDVIDRVSGRGLPAELPRDLDLAYAGPLRVRRVHEPIPPYPTPHYQAVRQALLEGLLTPKQARALGHFDAYPDLADLVVARPAPPPAEPARSPEATAPPPPPTAPPATPRPELPPPRLEPPPADRIPRTTGRAGGDIGTNLDRLDTTPEIKDLYSQVVEQNPARMMAARRGRMTFDEIIRLSREVGLDEDAIRRRAVGEVFNAEQIVRARDLLLASTQRLQTLLEEARAFERRGEEIPEALVQRFAEAVAHHVPLHAQVDGATTEIARALAAHRILAQAARSPALRDSGTRAALEMLAGESQAIRGDLGPTQMATAVARARQVMRLAAAVPDQDVRGLNLFLRRVQERRWADRIFEAWMASILSGPRTHLANIAGNTLFLMMTTAERGLAGAIDAVQARVTGRPREVFAREAIAELAGMWNALVSGRAMGKAALAWRLEMEGGKLDRASPLPAIPGPTGRLIRIPLRALSAEDAFFKALVWETEMHAGAFRIAAREGLAGDALARRVAALIQDPTPGMLLRAEHQMQYRTFQAELGPIGRWVLAGRALIPFARYLVPFVRTVTNITTATLERTPWGFAPIGVKALRGEAHHGQPHLGDVPIAPAESLARPILGSIIMLTFGALAANAIMMGGGGVTPRNLLRAQEETGEALRYSLPIPGTGWRFGVNRLEPVGALLGMAADIVELERRNEHARAAQLADAMMRAIVTNLTNKTFLSGLLQLSALVNDPLRYGESWLQGQGRSIIPYGGLVGSLARGLDPVERQVEGPLAAIRAQIPIARTWLPPRLGLLGEPIVSQEAGLVRAISPVRFSRLREDRAAERMLTALGIVPEGAPRVIHLQDRAIDLTPEERMRYHQTWGQRAKSQLLRAYDSDWYRQLDRDQQREVAQDIIRDAKRATHPMLVEMVRTRVGAGR
jgi:hypothetical protein